MSSKRSSNQAGNSFLGTTFPAVFKVNGVEVSKCVGKGIKEIFKLMNAGDPEAKITQFPVSMQYPGLTSSIKQHKTRLRSIDIPVLTGKYLELSEQRLLFLEDLGSYIWEEEKKSEIDKEKLKILKGTGYISEKWNRASDKSKRIITRKETAIMIADKLFEFANNKHDLELQWVYLTDYSYYDNRANIFVGNAQRHTDDKLKLEELKSIINKCHTGLFGDILASYKRFLERIFELGFVVEMNMERGNLNIHEASILPILKHNKYDDKQEMIAEIGHIIDNMGNFNSFGGQLKNDGFLLAQPFYGKTRPPFEKMSEKKDYDDMMKFLFDLMIELKSRKEFKEMFKEKMEVYRMVLGTNPSFSPYRAGAGKFENQAGELIEGLDIKLQMVMTNPDLFKSFNDTFAVRGASEEARRQSMRNFLIHTRRLKPRPPAALMNSNGPIMLVKRTRVPGKPSLVFAMTEKGLMCIGATTDIPQVRAAYAMAFTTNATLMEFLPPFETVKNIPVGYNFSSDKFSLLLKDLREYCKTDDPLIFLNNDAVSFDINFPHNVEKDIITQMVNAFEGSEFVIDFFQLLRRLNMTSADPDSASRDHKGEKLDMSADIERLALFITFTVHCLTSGGFHTPIINWMMSIPVWFAKFKLTFGRNIKLFCDHLINYDAKLKANRTSPIGHNCASGDDITGYYKLNDPKLEEMVTMMDYHFSLIGLDTTPHVTSNFLRRSLIYGNNSNEAGRAMLQNLYHHEKEPKELPLLNLGVLTRISRVIGCVIRDPYKVHFLRSTLFELNNFDALMKMMRKHFNTRKLMPQILDFMTLLEIESKFLQNCLKSLNSKEKDNFFSRKEPINDKVMAMKKEWLQLGQKKDKILLDFELMIAKYLGINEISKLLAADPAYINNLSPYLKELLRDKYSASSRAILESSPELTQVFELHEHSMNDLARESSIKLGLGGLRYKVWQKLVEHSK